MARTKLTGYTDEVSYTAGDTVRFQVSAEGATEAEVEIVRLIHGDEHPEGPGFIEEVVPSSLSGTHPVRRQFIDIGARVDVDDPQGLLDLQGSFTIHAFVFPSTPGKGRLEIAAPPTVIVPAGERQQVPLEVRQLRPAAKGTGALHLQVVAVGGNGERLAFEAPLPEDLHTVLEDITPLDKRAGLFAEPTDEPTDDDRP